MENFKKNICEIRKYMEDSKAEKYKIEKDFMSVWDEYTKSLYLRMLSTVIQYDNDPNDAQLTFLKRIIAGVEAENGTEDYMRRALEISLTDFQEFIDLFKADECRYYFCIDAIVLSALGERNDDCWLYLAELLETLNISMADLKHMSSVASAILNQNSEEFDESKNLVTDNTKNLNYASYIKNFYAGAIIDSDTEKYYSAPERQQLECLCSDAVMTFTENKITFDTLKIEINSNWNFNGCESVEFKNCIITYKEGNIHMDNIGTAIFENCIIKDFRDRVVELGSVNNFRVTNSEFINCVWNGYGGIFYSHSARSCNQVTLNNNKLVACSASGGVFMYIPYSIFRFELKNNTFRDCRGSSIIEDLNAKEVVDENNICHGNQIKIFNNM